MQPLYPLERYSPRALNLIATIISGQEARAVLSRRSKAQAVTVLESRTVILDPSRTDLYDLVLTARLLRHRGERRNARRDRVPRRLVRRWAEEARNELRRAYPAIGRLAGRFRDPAADGGLDVVWKRVDWEPLPPDAAGLPGRVGLHGVPGVEMVGAEDDYAWVAEALRSGAVPLEHLSGLPGVPVATVPLQLSLSQALGPRIEALEEQVAQSQEIVQGLMQCYQRKSETLLELLPVGRHLHSGVRLDSTRLVEGVVARRTGGEPRLFRRRVATFQPIFDPSQHLVVLGIDLNDLRRGSLADPSFSHRFLGILIRVYQQLGVDFVVLGFADHLLELSDGSKVYVHVPLRLKGVDEPFDGLFWNRVAHVLEGPPALPGEPACYHPLLMRTIGREMDEVARDYPHSYRAILFGTRRGMPRGREEFHSPIFLARTAEALDGEITAIRQRFEGTLDTLGSFVPQELKDHARPGGAVAEMYT